MTYASEVAADSPYLYWRLGDASGTTCTDSSGNARHGTYVGSPTLGTTGLLVGDADTAMATNGSSNMVAERAETLDPTAFTIEAWTKHTSNSGTRHIAGRENAGSDQIYRLSLSAGSPAVDIWNGAGTTANVTGTTMTINTVNHLAATYDGTTLRLYVNGVSVGTPSTAVSGALRTTDVIFTVASRTGGGNRFAGTLDEVAYYTTALSAARVLAHYNAGAPAAGAVVSRYTGSSEVPATVTRYTGSSEVAGTVKRWTGTVEVP